MAKQSNREKSDKKCSKTEDLQEIIKRKELQNKMFEKLISDLKKSDKHS